MDIESLSKRPQQMDTDCDHSLVRTSADLESLAKETASAVQGMNKDGVLDEELQRLRTDFERITIETPLGYHSSVLTANELPKKATRPPPTCRLFLRRPQETNPESESIPGQPNVTEPSLSLQAGAATGIPTLAAHLGDRQDLSNLRKDSAANVTNDAGLAKFNRLISATNARTRTGTGRTRSGSDGDPPAFKESFELAIEEAKLHRRALSHYGARLTLIAQLGAEYRRSPTALREMVTIAQSHLDVYGPVSPRPQDQQIGILVTLKATNDKTESEYRKVGELMESLYEWMSRKELLEGP